MGYRPKQGGRVARDTNNAVREDINRAHDILSGMIGEPDPIKVQRTLRTALPLLRTAMNGSWQIEQIYALAAQRGSYKKQDKSD